MHSAKIQLFLFNGKSNQICVVIVVVAIGVVGFNLVVIITSTKLTTKIIHNNIP
jgi:hypothetical protein